jgi:hypothetical protein
MYMPTITLPNSKLRISLPMYRLVMDSTRPKGHGIIPDLAIPPSSDAIKKGHRSKNAADQGDDTAKSFVNGSVFLNPSGNFIH